MEVSGKKLQEDASVMGASYCQPCSQDGETLPAEAYCTVCKEFMCSNCTNAHKKQKMLKFHALLDKSSIPTAMEVQSDVPQSTEPCDIHPEEFIKYFCPIHQTLNCGHCLAKEHRTCHVDIIAEISMCFKDCKEYEDISKAISQLSNALENCVEDVETKLKLIKDLAEDEVSNLRDYRTKINTYFDERENALLKIIEKMKCTDETRLHSMKPKCDDLRAKVEEIKFKIAEQEENTSQLFIEVKRAKKQIESLQSGLANIKQGITYQRYQMRKDPATERLLLSSTGLGTVDEKASGVEDTLNSNSRAEPSPPPSMHAEARKKSSCLQKDHTGWESDDMAKTDRKSSGLSASKQYIHDMTDTDLWGNKYRNKDERKKKSEGTHLRGNECQKEMECEMNSADTDLWGNINDKKDERKKKRSDTDLWGNINDKKDERKKKRSAKSNRHYRMQYLNDDEQ